LPKMTQETKNPLAGNNPIKKLMENAPGRKISKKGLFEGKRSKKSK
jgi:hypothetical protein